VRCTKLPPEQLDQEGGKRFSGPDTTMAGTAQVEVASLDRVLTRLAITEESQLEQVILGHYIICLYVRVSIAAWPVDPAHRHRLV
jgi:hypothetical protein